MTMVFTPWLFIETVNVMSVILQTSQRYLIMNNVTVPVVPTPTLPVHPLSTFIPDGPKTQPSRVMTVSEYGRKKICGSFDGKKGFYEVLKTKLCDLTLMLTAEHVIYLCERKDSSLDSWVSAIYDLDGDGYISHHELT